MPIMRYGWMKSWSWVNTHQLNAPLYWIMKDGQWQEYTLGGVKPIVGNEVMCHVSYFEADAFARWKGCRLPTEFEWEAAADQIGWGQRWEWTNSAYCLILILELPKEHWESIMVSL